MNKTHFSISREAFFSETRPNQQYRVSDNYIDFFEKIFNIHNSENLRFRQLYSRFQKVNSHFHQSFPSFLCFLSLFLLSC